MSRPRHGGGVEGAVPPRVPVRPAAAVILLREHSAGLSVLLLQRAAALAFAHGEWAFPGGKVDTLDSACWDGELPAAERALYVAACRETLEECGVLLACDAAEKTVEPALVAEVAAAWQHGKVPRAEGFEAALRRFDLRVDVAALHPWANWVTPPFSAQRFDTLFFIARAPQGQHPSLRGEESQALRWLELGRDGSMESIDPPIGAPPTYFNLLELSSRWSSLGSLESLCAATRALPLAPIMIKLLREPQGLVALMPWDAQYSLVPGEGVDWPTEALERFKILPSRRVIDPQTGRLC